jgi:hypothetical protein
MHGIERVWHLSLASVFATGCQHGWRRFPSYSLYAPPERKIHTAPQGCAESGIGPTSHELLASGLSFSHDYKTFSDPTTGIIGLRAGFRVCP